VTCAPSTVLYYQRLLQYFNMCRILCLTFPVLSSCFICQYILIVFFSQTSCLLLSLVAWRSGSIVERINEVTLWDTTLGGWPGMNPGGLPLPGRWTGGRILPRTGKHKMGIDLAGAGGHLPQAGIPGDGRHVRQRRRA